MAKLGQYDVTYPDGLKRSKQLNSADVERLEKRGATVKRRSEPQGDKQRKQPQGDK